MKNIFICCCLLFSLSLWAQKPDSQKILEEGKFLYRLEKASWNATDHFLETYVSKIKDITGYLSYESSKNKVITIFFNQVEQTVSILARYEFSKDFSESSVDVTHNEVYPVERELITIRQDALERIARNEDRYFTFYDSTSLNLIPVIDGKKRGVYMLTAPKQENMVLLGNDYLLKYNKKNKFVSKEKIHNSLISLPGKQKDMESSVTMHSHVLSDLISPTDICTLLLYKDFVEWKQHYVISKNYLSIFDLEKETLVIVTRDAWKKILEHQK